MKTTNTIHKLPPQALFLQCIQPSYPLVFTIFFIFYFIPEWWYIPPFVLIILLVIRYIQFKRTSYRFAEDTIYFRTNKTIEIATNTITKLIVHQTFLQRKLNIATVYMTSGDNVNKLSNIPLEHAQIIEQIYMKGSLK